MTIAADPTSPVPGFYLTVDLLAGRSSAGSLLKYLIIGQRETGEGDITDDTELREVFSETEVLAATGRGTIYFAYRAILDNDPAANVSILCAANGGSATAAAGTFTFSGTPTDTNVFDLWVGDQFATVSWLVGEAVTDIRDKAVAAINTIQDRLMALASAGTGGVVDVDSRVAGPVGNDIKIRVVKRRGAGGSCAAGATTLTGGTVEPDYTTALSTVSTMEFDFIVPCLSNAEAQAAGTTNQSRLEDHIDSLNTGSSAKLQQAILASTGTFAQAATGAVGRNSAVMEHICLENARELPCQLAGAEAGKRMAQRKLGKSHLGMKLAGRSGSADLVTDTPSDPKLASAITNGVSPGGYTANGKVRSVSPVTTRSQDDDGNPDTRARDVHEIDALYDWAKDMRAFIPQEFQNTDEGVVYVVANQPDGTEDLPANVVECREIKASIVERTLNQWRNRIDILKFREKLPQLTVTINAQDENQVDIFVPLSAWKLAKKIGLYAAKDA